MLKSGNIVCIYVLHTCVYVQAMCKHIHKGENLNICLQITL